MKRKSRAPARLAGRLLLLAACAPPLVAQQPAPVQQGAPPSPASPTEEPGWLEGLLYNPAERTREGAEALDAGAPAAASKALDAAMRLDPASDRARYNAGTARLLASSAEAAPLLESAARSSDAALAARAFYNLGNSRMAGEDYAGAVEAYKDSLRRDPASADAKFNLELALRRLREQQKNQQKQNQQNQNQNQQNQDQQDQDRQDQDQQQGGGQQDQENRQPGDEKKDGQEQQQEEQQQQSRDEQQEKQQPPQQQQKGGQGQQSPLPQFRDLPDMDAQQAAAILEAIENLERGQRREDAKKALKANASGKKDW